MKFVTILSAIALFATNILANKVKVHTHNKNKSHLRNKNKNKTNMEKYTIQNRRNTLMENIITGKHTEVKTTMVK